MRKFDLTFLPLGQVKLLKMTKLAYVLSSLCLCASVVYGQIEPTQPQKVDSVQQIKPSREITANIGYIIPPVGYDTSTYFAGYINFRERSAIIMHEVENATVKQIEEGIPENYFTDNNLVLLKKESFTSKYNTSGVYYQSSFVNKEETFVRTMVYAGNGEHMLILDIVYPRTSMEKLEPGIIECIDSINFQR